MKNLLSLPLFLILCASSCERMPLVDVVYRIRVINNSPIDMYIYKADADAETQYPDTLLPSSNTKFFKLQSNKIWYYDSKNKWNENIKKLPADTLSVFLIDADIFENKDWNTICDNYLILKRYDLSIEDLEKTDYTITYP